MTDEDYLWNQTARCRPWLLKQQYGGQRLARIGYLSRTIIGTRQFTRLQACLIYRIIFQLLAYPHGIERTDQYAHQGAGNGNLQNIKQGNVISGQHTQQGHRSCRNRTGSNSLLGSNDGNPHRAFRTNTRFTSHFGNDRKYGIGHMPRSGKEGKR